MKCSHCCYACGPDGDDMSEETFKAAADHAADDGGSLSIGGGEPTLHPRFWQFLGYAMSKLDSLEGGIWLATNGKRTDDAVALAKMARSGVIAVALSQDRWHEKINERVVRAFTFGRRASIPYGDAGSGENDLREIRDVGLGYQGLKMNPIRAGRWRGPSNRNTDCPCEDYFVEPNGTVRQCGCKGSTVLGDVFKGFRTLSEGAVCYKTAVAEEPVELALQEA